MNRFLKMDKSYQLLSEIYDCQTVGRESYNFESATEHLAKMHNEKDLLFQQAYPGPIIDDYHVCSFQKTDKFLTYRGFKFDTKDLGFGLRLC